MSQVLTEVSRIAGLQVVESRNARRVIAVMVFALLTALSAHVAFPLPGTAVPVTLQTLVVTLGGLLLGPYLGAAAQVAYLAAGVAGLPMFTFGGGFAYLMGPTGGYLLAFPVAAALTGVLAGPAARTEGVRGFLRMAAVMVVTTGIILGLGATQLALLTGDIGRAIELGVLPFLLGDVVKIALAALIALKLRRRTLEQL